MERNNADMIYRLDADDQLADIIRNSENLLVYFFNDNCAPCVALRPKVEELMNTRFPLMDMVYADVRKFGGLTAVYQAYSIPLLIFFFEGKEYLRFSKYISVHALEESIGRIYDLYHLPG